MGLSAKTGNHRGQIGETADDGICSVDFAEAVGGMDKGNTGLEGSLPVFFCVADIDALGVVVAVHDQADVLALGETGALPFLDRKSVV